jgi:hypothetical protein
MALDVYRVAGRSAATAATIDHVAAALWNPSTGKRIILLEIHLAKTVATVDNQGIQRITTRGTPGSTVTPDIDNDDNASLAPVSGALLDLAAYTVQPTLAGPNKQRWNLPAAIGAGVMWVFGTEGLTIPAGTGIAVVTPVAVIHQPGDWTFVWRE